MSGEEKTGEQLILELAEMSQRIRELEQFALQRRGPEEALRESGGKYGQLFDEATVGLSGTLSDLTDQKLAAVLVDRTEAKYRSLFDNSVEGIFQCTWDGRFLVANPACAGILGYAFPEELIAQDSAAHRPHFVHPERYKELQRILEENGLVKGYEAEVYRKDGSKIWISTNAWAMRDASGTAVFYEGTLGDITEEKFAKEKLRESEERYRSLVELSPDMIALHSQGKYVYINPAGVKMLGASEPEELIGKSILEIIHPDYLGIVKERIRQLEEEKGVPPLEEKYIRLDQKIVDVEVAATLIHYQGQLMTQVVARNITERKKAEEAVKRLAEENAIMAEIGQIISSTLNVEEVYERFAEEVRKLIQFDRIAINLINPEDKTFTIPYTLGSNVAEREVGKTIPLAGTGAEWVRQNRSSLLILGENQKEVIGRFPGLLPLFNAGFRSVMLVPLISKDQVIAVLNLQTVKGNAYTEADLKLAEKVGHQIAGAIINAQLFAERKRAEEALRKSEERFRDLYDSAPVGYHEYDTEGRITNVNRTDLEILGYSQEEMIGHYVWKFNVEEDIARPQIFEKLKGLRPPGRSLERTYRRKDGTTFPVLIEDRLNKDELGRITGIRCTIQDITERKRAEEALRKSEETASRLARVNAVLADIGRIVSSTLNIDEIYEKFAAEVRKLIPFDRLAVSLFNAKEGTITRTYVAGLDIEGRQRGSVFPMKGTISKEMMRTQSSVLVQTDSLEELKSRFPGMISPFVAGLRSTMSVRLISGDNVIGGLLFRSKTSKAYTDEDVRIAESIANQIAGAIANAQLFAERRRAEESLVTSEEKYRLLVQNASEAIFIVQDGVIKFPNPKTETVIGYSSTELAKMPFINFIHPDDRNGVIENYRKGLNEEKIPGFSFRTIDRAGAEKWVEVNGIPLNWEGKPATLVFLRDITEQKKLESKLQQSQKLEAIGTLAGGIAHDFNNILAAIMGYAELIAWEVPQTSKAGDNLKELLKAGCRARDLVQQILTFSRQSKQERKPVEIGPIIKEALKLLRASLPSSIEIKQEIEKDIGKIEADPTQIHQVLMNLCTNAGHAMSESGGVLEVRLSHVDLDATAAAQYSTILPGPYIRLSVSDTGHGMSPEVCERIFDPYFTTKEVGKGSGLGLAVVDGIVKSHRGAITVYSKPGKGTTFHVYFPRIDHAQGVRGTQEVESPFMGGNERILFIDDEQTLVDVGEQILRQLGYQVTVRTKSIEALELFRAHPERFDLVITDMTMPNMMGDKLAKELMGIRADIPIVLCTGFSEYITEEAAKEIGIREFVMKPLVTSGLAKTIRRVLDRQRKRWS